MDLGSYFFRIEGEKDRATLKIHGKMMATDG